MSYFCRENVSQIGLEIVANCSHPSEILALHIMYEKTYIFIYIFHVFVFQVHNLEDLQRIASDAFGEIEPDGGGGGHERVSNARGCFCDLCFVLVMLSCLFIAALWSSAEKKLTSCLACFLCSLVFCHFAM